MAKDKKEATKTTPGKTVAPQKEEVKEKQESALEAKGVVSVSKEREERASESVSGAKSFGLLETRSFVALAQVER